MRFPLSSVFLAPDREPFVFTRSTGEEKNDIFVVWSGGAGLRRLTTSGRAYDPCLAPDGRTVVFSQDRALYVLNVDGGSKPHLLIRVPGWDCRYPSFSARGDRIVFSAEKRASEGPDGVTRLYLARSDGTGLTLVRTAPIGGMEIFATPALSPDGSSILYVNNGFGVGEASLHLLSLATKRTRQIAGNGKQRTFYDAYHPAFSPDGRRIAAQSACHVRGDNRTDMLDESGEGIVVMNADGTGQSLVYRGRVLSGPRWSRDGRALLFTTDAGLHRLDLQTRKDAVAKLAPRPGAR